MEKIPVLYENDEIFVINKKAGVSVQGGEGIAHPLDEEFSKQLGYKIFLVHRLDKETSGLMVVAKNPKAASKWIDLIASKSVQKEYTAVCFGQPVVNGKKEKKGVISSSLIKKNGKKKQEQSAHTEFIVENIFEKELFLSSAGNQGGEGADVSREKITQIFSKIHLKLGTGRMHQIRIHLASVGAPICGDDKYGNFKLNKLTKKNLKIKNLLLCSSKLTIPLADGSKKTFEIELPDYFNL